MRKINIQVSSGLGDRFLTLLFYCVNFGLENEINIFWEKNHCLNCDYSKLIQNKIKISSEFDNFFELPSNIPVTNRKYLIENYLNNTKQDVLIKGQVFDKTRDFRKLSYKKYFENFIKPVDEISSVVENYMNNEFNSSVIGVHFRTADKIKNLFYSNGKSFFQVLEEYEKIIDSYIEKDFKIFLATDDSGPKFPFSDEIQDLKLRDYFKTKYGSRIIEFPCRSFKRNSEEAIIDAFCVLILLTKCDFFVGSSVSSFSKLICSSFEKNFKLI